MATYYVSSGSGRDTNSGTSPHSAFATLQAAADRTEPGDTVEVMGGTYTAAPGLFAVLAISTSGTAAAPITYEAAPGQHPTINSTGDRAGIMDEGASYITISGFEVVGDAASLDQATAAANQDNKTLTQASGIWVSNDFGPTPTHVTVQGNTVHDEPAAGIWAGHGDYISILDNTTYRNAFWSNEANSGISVGWMVNSDSDTVDYKVVVSGNVSYGNREYIGFVGQNGVITDGNGIIVDSDNDTGYTGRTLVSNNLTYGNGGTGAHAINSNNVDFLYNTAYGNNQTPTLHDGQIAAMDGSNNRIENNVMVASGGSGVVNTAYGGATSDYNVYYGGSVGAKGAHDIVADPGFVDAGSGSFALTAGSPAIDSASPAFTTSIDVSGAPRPSGSGYDRGAYEYQQASPAPAPAPTPTPAPTTPAPSAGSDTLVLHLSEDAWQGDAQFATSLDGQSLASGQAVTAQHGSGQTQDFTLLGAFGAGPHDVAISFLNDAWGGTPATDRNLYVDGITYDGAQVPGATAALYSNGTTHFQIPALTGGQ